MGSISADRTNARRPREPDTINNPPHVYSKPFMGPLNLTKQYSAPNLIQTPISIIAFEKNGKFVLEVNKNQRE